MQVLLPSGNRRPRSVGGRAHAALISMHCCETAAGREQGFFYNRLPQPANGSVLAGRNPQDRQRQLWYHVVGTPQAQDAFVLALPEQPDASITSRVSSDKQCAPGSKLVLLDVCHARVTGACMRTSAVCAIISVGRCSSYLLITSLYIAQHFSSACTCLLLCVGA